MTTALAATPLGFPPARNSVFALLAGAAVAGFGGMALGLALMRSIVPEIPALPPIVPVQAELAEPPRNTPRDWPALFGEPPPPAPEPEPVVEPEAPPPLAPLEVRLRGVAMDGEGGWALIEQGDAVLLVRPGSALTDDHTVESILTDAVVIASRDGMTTLGFEENDVREPVANRMQTSLQRSIMTGRHDFDQVPMPLPPADYRPGPGFMGPSNL